MTAHPKDQAYVHFGRGGAGNIVHSTTTATRRPSWIADSQSPSTATAPAGFPAGRRFSTGIGGWGNASAVNKCKDTPEADEEMVRLLWDRQAPGIVLVEGGYHTGRGGAANVCTNTNLEDQEARSNNENMRRQSVASMNQRRQSLASLMPSSGETSRRGSIASVRDYLMKRRASKA
ncbi:hypothetical protein CLAIMM_06562 [Cladophialophora immunda]|nr:hypothetical protein CLAIMM_06562 [Cladophialophora immunda]